MYIEQLYTGCLSEAAYYIESEGEAAIIDPLRETEPYIKKAAERNATIKYIFETHFHADFVSGHIDLARKTNATIVYGPSAQTNYKVHVAKDEEVFNIGKIKIKVLHTPGHTFESVTYLLIDEAGKDHAIFTGDTLFIGDVGRPDLAIKSGYTQNDLAGLLYDSLKNKILPLSDDLIVYPAHGAGSACGKKMSNETTDTLGNQKKYNYALQAKSKEEFIKLVTEGILPPPQYFAKNAKMNKEGYESIDVIIKKGNKALSVEEFEKEWQKGTLIIDTRHQQTFCKGFIPDSIFIGLDGTFAVWVGALIEDINQPILLIADKGREEEAVMRLARVGYDHTVGYLNGGFDAWKQAAKPIDSIESITAAKLEAILKSNHHSKIVDTRKPSEYETAHVKNAILYPLDFINSHLNDLDKENTYYLHCRSGYRSMVASSILRKNGYKNIIDIDGGFIAIDKTSIPTETSVNEPAA